MKRSKIEKAAIVLAGITRNEPLNEVCRDYGISTRTYYRWEDDFLNDFLTALLTRLVARERAQKKKVVLISLREILGDKQREQIKTKNKIQHGRGRRKPPCRQ